MTQAVQQTPIQPRLNCDEGNCKKNFKSQGTMMQHKDKFHQMVTALTQSPLANSVRTLFQGESVDDTSQQSTQGGSNGSVNSSFVVNDDLINGNEEEEIALDELSEDAEDDIIASELERLAKQYGYTGPCKECKMGKEVNDHQATVIKELESKVALMQRRQVKTDEKKNELGKEKKEAITENAKLRIELKKYKDMTEQSSKPEVTAVDQKCKQCKFTCKDSNNMDAHIAQVHSLQSCHICSEVFTSKAAMRNHVKKHLNNELEYTCGVCKKSFKTIEGAKDHAMKVCGSIHEKEDMSSGKKQENSHTCKFCNKSYTNTTALQKHIEEMHEIIDCDKCKAIFKSQEDTYTHANKCSKIIGPYMCENCNLELISRAGLEKHNKRCHADNTENILKSHKDPCKNGANCRFHKAIRCLFQHEQPRKEHWKKVQPRRQARQPKPPSQEAHSRNQSMPQKNQQTRHGQDKSVCLNGPSCYYLK